MKISSLPHHCVGRVDDGLMDVLQWFEIAQRRGLDGVEVMDLWVMKGLMERIDLPLMAEIREQLSHVALEVSAFINHGPHVWPSPEKNKRELDKARLLMDWSAELGTQVFRVTTGARDPDVIITDDKVIDVFCDMIAGLLEHADALGLVIALEEHPGFAGTVAKMERLLARIPDRRFGIAYDMKNTMREGEEPTVILARQDVLDRVLYTHVDNYRDTAFGWDRSVTLDSGEVDIRRIVQGLKANGYDGWLSVEYGGTELEHVFQSIEWLRSVWHDNADTGT